MNQLELQTQHSSTQVKLLLTRGALKILGKTFSIYESFHKIKYKTNMYDMMINFVKKFNLKKKLNEFIYQLTSVFTYFIFFLKRLVGLVFSLKKDKSTINFFIIGITWLIAFLYRSIILNTCQAVFFCFLIKWSLNTYSTHMYVYQVYWPKKKFSIFPKCTWRNTIINKTRSDKK